MSDARGPEPPDGPPEFGEDPEHTEDELSSVVFDEHFVRAATIHEPTAAERRLAAAPPTPLTPPQGGELGESGEDFGEDPYRFHDSGTEGGFRPGAAGDPPGAGHDAFGAPPSRTAWWRQSVAWVLALLMGVGVVAMAVTAVAPGRSGQNTPSPQPTVGSLVPTPDTGPPATVFPAGVAVVVCPGDPSTGC